MDRSQLKRILPLITIRGSLYGNTLQSNNILLKVVGNEGLLTWITNGGKFVIKNKYDLKEIVLSNLDSVQSSDLKGLNKIKRIELTGHTTNAIKVDLSDFADTLPSDMEKLIFRRCNLMGDVSTLSNVALKTLEVSAQNVSGDVLSLNFSKMERLNIAETNIVGTLESIVAKAISSGRKTGSITMPYMKAIAKVTYQGVPLPTNSNVPAATGTNTLSWTADGTITLT